MTQKPFEKDDCVKELKRERIFFFGFFRDGMCILSIVVETCNEHIHNAGRIGQIEDINEQMNRNRIHCVCSISMNE